jgi:hypothetical protein
MKNTIKNITVYLALAVSAVQGLAQAKVKELKFQEILKNYHTQAANGKMMKCLHAFELVWSDDFQQREKVVVHFPHVRGTDWEEIQLYQWDFVLKTWNVMKGSKVEKVLLRRQEFDQVAILDQGIYAMMVPLEQAKGVTVSLPAGYQLKSFQLSDPTMNFVFKYKVGFSNRTIKIPVDLPPATARVDAVWLDRKGKRVELKNYPIERLDELTKEELISGKWEIKVSKKELLVENKLNQKKEKK